MGIITVTDGQPRSASKVMVRILEDGKCSLTPGSSPAVPMTMSNGSTVRCAREPPVAAFLPAELATYLTVHARRTSRPATLTRLDLTLDAEEPPGPRDALEPVHAPVPELDS
jgi:hypothetical protein